MVVGKQIQYWPEESVKTTIEIETDINEVKKCNQQTKAIRLFLEELKMKKLKSTKDT